MIEEIKQAESAIGEHESNDWRIQPVSFPDQLEANAQDLASFLKNSLYVEKAKLFEISDSLAAEYQSRFKKRALTTSIAIFVAAALTAMLSIIGSDSITYLVPYLPASESLLKMLSLIAGAAIFIASGIVVFNSQIITQLKLYDQWMENRAKAETARLLYFREAAQNLIIEKPKNIKLLLEFCCFYRRYQLQVQQAYYQGRSRQHSLSLLTTTKIGAIAAVIVAAFSGSSGLAGFFDQELVSFAALGTIGVALTALASRRESIHQDERNAMRYKITADVLSRVAEKYSSVQKALAAGKDPVILLHFVDAVHEQLSLEHRQWTEDSAEINTAFAELLAAETK